MSPALAALSVVVVAGGVVAVSARDARTSIVGLAVALAFAPLVAEPFPDGLVLAARIVAALLAAYLLWIVARDGFDVRNPRLRWPVEALVAAAAAAAGLSSAALTTSPASEVAAVGLPVARGAAFAIGALAIMPILEGRDALRLGTGLTLAVLAVALLEQGMGGVPSPVTHLAFAGVMVGVAATSARLGSVALAVADRGDRPVRAAAHPVGHGAEVGVERSGATRLLGGRTLAGLGVDAAVRDRLAMARVGDRLAGVGARSRNAATRVRSAGLGERTSGELRRRFARPAAQAPAVEPNLPASRTILPTSAPPEAVAGETHAPAIREGPAAGPSAVPARSAGARRSLRRSLRRE